MFRKKSLESHHYYDEKIFSQEIEHIFKKEWLWVGRSDQLKNRGDFITADVIHFPLIVLRDNNNQLRGFHNVCRHRASKVLLRSSGNCKHIVCPYHGWRYNLNGELSNPSKFFGSDDFFAKNPFICLLSLEDLILPNPICMAS